MIIHRFIDNYGCLLQQNRHGTCIECGRGDALWRTSLAFIAYKDQQFFDGMMACIDKNLELGKPNSIKRHPATDRKDTSRDQVIMLLVALFLKGENNECQELANQLKYRISNRYRWTIDSWFWVKMLGGKLWLKYLWSFLACFTSLAFLVNYPFKWLGIKNGKWYPHLFTAHLTAWMLFITPNNLFKWLATRIMLAGIPKSNLLIRRLLGCKIDKSKAVIRRGWQWQRLPWVHYHGIDLSEISREEAGFALDVDILEVI